MTKDEIQKLRRLCAAATPGEWAYYEGPALDLSRGQTRVTVAHIDRSPDDLREIAEILSGGKGISDPVRCADAAFIAAAREALPRALNEIECARSVLMQRGDELLAERTRAERYQTALQTIMKNVGGWVEGGPDDGDCLYCNPDDLCSACIARAALAEEP